MPDELIVIDGAEAGAWIAPRLGEGFGGMVNQQVPDGYDSYVRVFHPATDQEGHPVSWAEVAKVLGRVAHRQMQWHKLVGSDDPPGMSGSEWSGGNPDTGELDSGLLETLCGVLAIHTRNPSRCMFGLSTIFEGVGEAYPAAVPLHLPDRDYVVFAGPLSAATQVGYDMKRRGSIVAERGESRPPAVDASERWTQAPNLIWPADHSWYVSSEYDFDSTLVGGDRKLIDALMAARGIEAWEVGRNDSLEVDADKIN